MADDIGGEACVSESALLQEIGQVLAATAGRHPGIIAEAVVARLLAIYDLCPLETKHRERRKNHEERVRRFAHEVYRILAEPGDAEPGREIASRVAKAFILTPKWPAPDASPEEKP